MKQAARVCLAVCLAVGIVTVALAQDAPKTVTLTGKVQCAMCILKKADAKGCQDVLVVSGKDQGEYYIAKNEVSEKFPHVGCKGDKSATVTGTVAEKDGKRWLTATKMEVAQS
jgi:hypothetical protein